MKESKENRRQNNKDYNNQKMKESKENQKLNNKDKYKSIKMAFIINKNLKKNNRISKIILIKMNSMSNNIRKMKPINKTKINNKYILNGTI